MTAQPQKTRQWSRQGIDNPISTPHSHSITRPANQKNMIKSQNPKPIQRLSKLQNEEKGGVVLPSAATKIKSMIHEPKKYTKIYRFNAFLRDLNQKNPDSPHKPPSTKIHQPRHKL